MTEIVRPGSIATIISGWPLLLPSLAIAVLGVLTMHPFGADASLAPRQLLWIIFGLIVYGACAAADMHVLRRTTVIMAGYGVAVALLLLLIVFADPVQGAKSWFSFGAFSFQPSDLAKLVLIAFLAKYFSRRHIEIRDIRHLILAGIYAGVIIGLVLIQPDLGTAVILSFIWLGIALISGISKKHLAVVFCLAAVTAAGLWFFGLHDYQRTRLVAFLNPAADIRGAGYNAYQAVVAAGSGELFGKGVGYGTQSKLRFLPEYETDFIFAAFAEEWGFVGVSIILLLYGFIVFQLLSLARRAATNFDALFIVGVALLFLAHVFIHAGINLGLLPVTGTTIPFMSYGGSHLLVEFAALGIVVSLSRHARSVPRTAAGQEYLGA